MLTQSQHIYLCSSTLKSFCVAWYNMLISDDLFVPLSLTRAACLEVEMWPATPALLIPSVSFSSVLHAHTQTHSPFFQRRAAAVLGLWIPSQHLSALGTTAERVSCRCVLVCVCVCIHAWIRCSFTHMTHGRDTLSFVEACVTGDS